MLQLVSRRCGRSCVGATRALMALLSFLALPAFAQNLVQNPNFNTTLVPWTQFLSSAPDPAGAGSATWVPSPDADGNPGSGSAAINIAAAPAAQNAASGIDECVPFASTLVSSVNYGVSVRLPTTDPTDGGANATIEMRLFSDGACGNFISGAGGSQGQDIVSGIPNNATWYTLSDPNFQPAVPVTAASVQVRAYLRKTGASANAYDANFDKVFVFLNGSTPVRLQDFSVE